MDMAVIFCVEITNGDKLLEILRVCNKDASEKVLYNLVPQYICNTEDIPLMIEVLKKYKVSYTLSNTDKPYSEYLEEATADAIDEYDEIHGEEDGYESALDEWLEAEENAAYERRMDRLLQQGEERYE